MHGIMTSRTKVSNVSANGLWLLCGDRHGYYPESVHADQIYRTRLNRDWYKARGIRLQRRCYTLTQKITFSASPT